MDLSSLSDDRLKALADKSPRLAAAVEQELARRNAGGLKSYARSLGQAAFNLGDEAEAFVRNGFSTGGDYDLIKGQINSEIQKSYSDNPLLYGLEFGAGMMIPGAGLAKLGKGAQTIKGMMGRGGLVGGIDGGLSGYGASTEGNELEGTLLGLGLGGTLGGGLSGLAPAAARFMQGQTDPVAIIREAAARRGISAQEMADEMERLGPEAVLADTFPEMTGTAMGAAAESPFSPALGVLTERAKGARERLINTIPGDDTTAQRLGRSLKDERQRIANEDYSPVHSATFETGDAIELLQSPLAKEYIEKAKKALVSDPDSGFTSMSQLNKMLEGDAELDIPGALPATILQKARSMMSNRVNKLYEQGAAQEAADLEKVVRHFDDYLDQVPGYTQANANYARKSAEMRALEDGRGIGRSNRSVADEGILLEEITDPGLRENVAIGARSQLINDINLSGGLDGTGSPVSALGPLERRALRAQAANLPNLERNLQREARFSETFNTVDPKRGSATAMRKEAADQFERDNAVIGALADPISGGVGAALLAGWRKFVGKKLNIRSQDVADKVLDVLLKKGMTPDEVKKLMDNPEGVTELMKFLQGKNLRYGTGALTGAGLQAVAPLYEQN
jgi:hypothetical protein